METVYGFVKINGVIHSAEFAVVKRIEKLGGVDVLVEEYVPIERTCEQEERHP